MWATKLRGTEGFVNLVNTPVTVSCPSNGHSASSTSGLLAPAAQSSAGRAACSCLPWPAVLPRRPHRPHTTPTTGQAIPLLTHTPCYSAATAASHRSRTNEPSCSSPRTVLFRWKSVVDHIDHAAPRVPRWWRTTRPRKGMTRSQGRHGSGSPRGEEYEGSLVRLRCEAAVAAGPGQRQE